jgi:hypothetical protein
MTFQSNLNATQAATQQDNIMNSFIQYYIDNELQLLKDLILGGAPEALDTLKELADAISSDPDFFQSMADSNAALQTAIDAVQADVDQNESDSDAAIAAETSARTVAVDAEASTRQAAIDAVNALITTLQTEAAARLVRIEALEADPTTQTLLDAEATARDNADNALDARLDVLEADPTTQTLLDAEQTAREGADAALSGRLDVLEVDPTTAAAVAAVQSDVDQNEIDGDAADAALSGRLDTLEADPTTQAAVDLKAPLADPTFTGDVSFGSLGRINPSGNELKFLNDTLSSGIVLGNKITLQSNTEVEVFGDLVIENGLTDAADDTAAAAAGVDVNQLYRNGSVVMIRVS